MKYSQEEFTLICDAIRNAGLEPRDYSGRGMYGKECLGFTTDNEIADCVNIALTLAPGDVIDAAALFNNSRTDSMGRSTIVYFPSVPWFGEEEEEEENE